MATIRVPELPSISAEHPLMDNDEMIVYSYEDNKTRKTNLAALRQYLEVGGETGMQPIIDGGTVTYIVPASDAGGMIAHIPQLAGQSFNLYRSGQYLIPESNPSGSIAPDFRTLAAGGFQLLSPNLELQEGERFVLQVFTLVGGSNTVISGGSGSGKKFNGKVIVSTNTTLTAANHIGKVIQLRGGNNRITVTLPALETVEDFETITIEAGVQNTKQQKVATPTGQLIYMNNAFFNELYLNSGETLEMYKDSDGWYVLNNFGHLYKQIGKIETSYRVEDNELELVGQLVNRADYPRLWNYIQSLGSSLVSDSVWNTLSMSVNGQTVARPYRGCYSTGDGSTTFRLPDFRDQSIRGLAGGSDNDRGFNNVGGHQAAQVGQFQFTLTGYQERKSGTADTIYVLNQRTGASTPQNFDYTVNAGKENTMQNIGVRFTVKI